VLSTDIHRMTALTGLRLQLSKDFGNGNSSTPGSPAPQQGTSALPARASLLVFDPTQNNVDTALA
jgi:hypothetical protein